ncbi:TonB-dependent receptor [Agaricicola taiwanensis]|uniref:TonB-dependent receptor n=1 Tax=Agaricicola taiwanensis TaxID=591372 RepID=A0A8J2YK33_9RHOB|nr:TonB-dependent receptor [Agaricicola taiwanensis]GGE48663.1 TonB-dependent receptor [Agaricicola taiwanensis]
MKRLTRAALIGGSVSISAMAVVAGSVRLAEAQTSGQAAYSFNIPSKPLLAALADFTATTGIQVVRPSSQRLSGQSVSVSGQLSAGAALSRLLSSSGLAYEFTGSRTVTIHSPAGEASSFAPPAPGDAVELPPIEVSGAGSLAQGGVSEINITSADLERKNPTNIKDVFAGEPGVKVGSSIPMSQKVYVHGIEETNLAVSIDGSRQNNKVFHHNGTTLIDPSFLKAARVDAGVAPADAGPGALGGSIAYETKDARDMLLEGKNIGAFVKSTFNTNGGVSMNNVAGYGATENVDALAYFTLGRGGKFEAGNGDEVLGTATNLTSGLGKIGFQTDAGYRMEFSHEMVVDDAARPFRANTGFITFVPPRTYEPAVRDYRLDRTNTTFTFSHTAPTGLWDPKVVLAYSGTEVDLFVFPRPAIGAPYKIDGKTDSFNGKAENRFHTSFGSITAGADFYRDEASLDDPTEASREEAQNVGIYAQARLEPWSRARLSFGGRADHQTFTGTGDQEFNNSGLSGNVSGELDIISNHLTAKAGYSHVWAGIPLAENFILNPAWTYLDGPEEVTSDNATAGLVARYNGFTLEGTVFRTEIDNARQPAYANFAVATGVYGAIRNRDIESKGFEIGLGYEWASGFIRFEYANIDVEIDGKPADSDTGNYLASPAGDIFTLSAAHTFSSIGLTIGGDMEIAPEYDKVAEGSPPYKAYEVFNAFAEYKPISRPNLAFRAEVQNIFDETYADRATYGQEFGTVTPLYEPGRSFILSASAKF